MKFATDRTTRNGFGFMQLRNYNSETNVKPRYIKIKKKFWVIIPVVFFLIFSMQNVWAQSTFDNNSGTGDGNWNTLTNWEPEGVPGNVAVTIASPYTCLLDITTANPSSLTIQDGATLDLNANTITVDGAVTINGTLTDGGTGGFVEIGGDFTVNSTASFTSGPSLRFNGTTTMSGSYADFMTLNDFTVDATATSVTNSFSSSAVEIVTNNVFTVAGGTFTAGSSTYTLNRGTEGNCLVVSGSATLTGSTSTFNVSQNLDLTISETTSGTVTFNNFTHIPTAGSATLTVSGDFVVNGTLTVGHASDGFTGTGSISYSSGNLVYTTGRDITVGPEWPDSDSELDNITIDASTGTPTITLDDIKTVDNLTVTDGTLEFDGNDLIVNSGNTLLVDGGTVAASIETIDINGTLTLSAAGTLNVDDLNINSNATFNKGSGTLSLGGTGIFYLSGSTLVYTTTQTAGGEWPLSNGPVNVTIQSGTLTQSSTRTISGNLTLAASTEIDLGTADLTTQGNATLNHQSSITTTGTAQIDGNLTIDGDGTIGDATAGTLEMNGGEAQTVTLDGDITVFNFTVNKTNAAEVVVTASAGSALKFWDNATAKVLRVQDGVLSFGANASIEDGSGGTITNNSVTLQVDGAGTFRTGGTSITDFASYSLSGTVEYTGSGSVVESIPSAAFTDLTINSTSSNNIIVSSGASPTVSGTLDLTNSGIIETTSSNTLTLSLGSTLSGGSANSYINGPLTIIETGTLTFPLGDNGDYRPVELLNVVGTAPEIEFSMTSSDPGGQPGGNLNNISEIRYWQGSVNGGSFTSCQVRLYWGDNDAVDSSPLVITDLEVATSATQSGTYTDASPSTASGDNSSGTVTSASVGAIQYFTLGSTTGDNSLPVSLTSFQADLSFGGGVSLTWTTESELENEGFNVHRRDIEESAEWALLNNSVIPGQGNTADKTEYEYNDRTARAGITYEYMLESLSYSGVRVQEQVIEIAVPMPNEYTVLGNYPNPFNPTTQIAFRLPETSDVSILIYGIQGNLVRELTLNQSFEAGDHFITWDATDNNGQPVASGMYVYLFTAGKYNKTEKMLLLK